MTTRRRSRFLRSSTTSTAAGLALEEPLDPGHEGGTVGTDDHEQPAGGGGTPEPDRHPAESSAQQHRQRFPGSREGRESLDLASRRSRCVQHSPWISRSSPGMSIVTRRLGLPSCWHRGQMTLKAVVNRQTRCHPSAAPLASGTGASSPRPQMDPASLARNEISFIRYLTVIARHRASSGVAATLAMPAPRTPRVAEGDGKPRIKLGRPCSLSRHPPSHS